MLLAAAPLAAQQAPAGLRAELIRDIEQLERKYIALAEAMPQEKLAWRPAEGVRSVGEVYAHIADANVMFAGIVGHTPPAQFAAATDRNSPARTTDRARLVDEMRTSFAHVKAAIEHIPDADLEKTVRMFGREVTVRAALLSTVTHMHEHLGQSIAYARANGVVPPWSAREQ